MITLEGDPGELPVEIAFDLLIAATAVAAALPLYTRNPDDFAGLSDMFPIIAV